MRSQGSHLQASEIARASTHIPWDAVPSASQGNRKMWAGNKTARSSRMESHWSHFILWRQCTCMQLNDIAESHPDFQGLFYQHNGQIELRLGVHIAHLLSEALGWPKTLIDYVSNYRMFHIRLEILEREESWIYQEIIENSAPEVGKCYPFSEILRNA